MMRAVIFDLGHTLWDITPQPEALARAYGQMRERLAAELARSDAPGGEALGVATRGAILQTRDGIPDAAILQRAVRDVLREAGETYFMNAAELAQPPSHVWVDRGCRKLGIQLDEALLREITPPLFATEIDGLVCAEGTREALSALSDAGYALGCVTNTLADGPTIRAMLRRHGLAEMMRTTVVSADEGWRKPHPSLFNKALRELGVAPHEAVFVGDSPSHDIAGARAAGMRAVLTQQYVVRQRDGIGPAPDAVISHLRELPGVILKLNSGSA